MIHVQNLTKSYRIKWGRHYVFRDVSMHFPEDANIGIIGPNGAGKTTLLRLLGNIDHPDSGRIVSDKSFSWPLGLKGGFVNHMTGRQNCRVVCNLYGLHPRNIKTKLEQIRELSGIGSYFEEPVKYYSTGMGGRLGFALSMAFDFDYFLIDEITTVGDANFKKLAKQALEEKARKSRVLMVSHAIEDLRKFCDTAILIKDGVLTVFDSLDAAIKAYLPQASVKHASVEEAAAYVREKTGAAETSSAALPEGVAEHLDEVIQQLDAVERALVDDDLADSKLTRDLAKVYERMGNKMKARHYYSLAVQADPYSVSLLLKLAAYALENDEVNECLHLLRKADELDPENPRVLVTWVRYYRRVGRPREAKASNDCALKVDPENARLWSIRAALLRYEGEKQSALEAARHAVRLDPENARYQSELSHLLAEAGDYPASQIAREEARLLKEAAARRPASPPSLESTAKRIKNIHRSLNRSPTISAQ